LPIEISGKKMLSVKQQVKERQVRDGEDAPALCLCGAVEGEGGKRCRWGFHLQMQGLALNGKAVRVRDGGLSELRLPENFQQGVVVHEADSMAQLFGFGFPNGDVLSLHPKARTAVMAGQKRRLFADDDFQVVERAAARRITVLDLGQRVAVLQDVSSALLEETVFKRHFRQRRGSCAGRGAERRWEGCLCGQGNIFGWLKAGNLGWSGSRAKRRGMGAGCGENCSIVIEVCPSVDRPIGHREIQAQNPAKDFRFDKFPLRFAHRSASIQFAFPLEVKSQSGCNIKSS